MMEHTAARRRWKLVLAGTVAAVVLGSAPAADAQTPTGQARAVQAIVSLPLGNLVSTLADTGTLSSSGDARDASDGSGTVPNLLSGNTLHATAIGSSDTSASEASLGEVAVGVAGNTIGAAFVMARALAVSGAGSAGAISISGLAVNGLAIEVSGEKNQTLAIPGGRIVINEQQNTGNATTVNALHIIVDGIADIVIASATAGIQ
jgi:hypothetical protein